VLIARRANRSPAIISSFIAVAGSLTPTVIMVVSFSPLITGLPLLSSHAARCALP
jgi:hypothetical protein